MDRGLAEPSARGAAQPLHARPGADPERGIRGPGGPGRRPAGTAVGRGLHRAAARVLAGRQRLRHRDRLPHLRLPRARPVPSHGVPGDRDAGPVGGALRPLRPVPGLGSRPGRRLDHGAVDPPADGRRALRRLHLAARTAGPGRPRPGRHQPGRHRPGPRRPPAPRRRRPAAPGNRPDQRGSRGRPRPCPNRARDRAPASKTGTRRPRSSRSACSTRSPRERDPW